jgi:hypothetical protein
VHPVWQILIWWALAFLSLGTALVLLNIFYTVIESDLTLLSLGWEIGIAAVASLIEGGSVWAVLTYVPAAGRALIIPALAVALLYKLMHFEDWNQFDVFALLAFQLIISIAGACFWLGQFSAGLTLLAVCFVCLLIVAVFFKGI